ncbi:MAG: TetR family transcriptional regulator [Reyranella sp.]|nr:TetR family transcriptional regulator [Reyranella sp.]
MDVKLSDQRSLRASNGTRVARTREAIVASALTLAAAGAVAPIVRDVAQMAGVSARTVFQHFSDTAELYVAVLARVVGTLVGETPELASGVPFEERVMAVVRQGAERFERLMPMWTFVETLQQRSTAAADMVMQAYTANQASLARLFDRELAALPAESREQALTALAVALAPESWVVLRRRLGLTADQARDELRFIVDSVFKNVSPGR